MFRKTVKVYKFLRDVFHFFEKTSFFILLKMQKNKN